MRAMLISEEATSAVSKDSPFATQEEEPLIYQFLAEHLLKLEAAGRELENGK